MSIDYGRGLTNIDLETGIRYGIISTNGIDIDDFQFNYNITCPECGGQLEEFPDEDNEGFIECPLCGAVTTDPDQFYSDEPDSITYSGEGYELALSVDSNEVWIFKAPYKAMGTHCSPCCPGAITLNGGDDAWAYCLGPEWFDGEVPYDMERI